MAESKLDRVVGNAAGAILLCALVGSLGSCAFAAIGQGINDARHPEQAAQRRAHEAAAVVAARQEEQERLDAAVARRAEHDRTMAALAEEARENEKRCIRQMDYETCRRIYRPTAAEMAAEQAIVDRAARIAEAHRAQ